MADGKLYSLGHSKRIDTPTASAGRILVAKLPYFSPWTPPLGIAILKSYLEQRGYSVRCVDFNVDPELWGMHHKYFSILQTLEDVSINDGYSKLWWIINAHMLAYANGAGASECSKVLETVVPLYGIRINRRVIELLLPLVDRFFLKLDDLISAMDLTQYSVAGASTYSTSLAASLFFLKRAKERCPRIKTVMGGGVFADDLALGSDNLDTLLRNYDYVDHAILGEGEQLFLKLLEGELSDKRMISIRDLGAATLEMKDVPSPDFSDFDLEQYYHLTIEGARSCPFQCSFCSETVQWGDYRKKPMDLFADQVIELARRHNINSFFLGDSLMNPYINQFASALLERKAGVRYDGYLRADKPVANRDFVKMWRESGLYRVRLGIESAAPRVLDAMDKMTTPQVISDVLKTLASAGVRTTTYWIVGFPGETEQDFQETCEFIREHHRHIYELEAHPYYYYPYGQIGSRLYDCRSLYPDDITELIKFRVWDIEGYEPAREERYDRLRRISSLATDLGLPNIYTMRERFQAEERWHNLYPLAAEVYEGTRLNRTLKPRPQQQIRPIVTSESGPHSALCYEALIDKKLSTEFLEKAAELLVHNNDILQRALDGLEFSPIQSSERLFIYFHKRTETDEPADILEILRTIEAEMGPEPGKSVRVVLLEAEGQPSRLFLLGHQSVADARTIVLLFEDLTRLYEGLSNNVEVSLRPIEKTYFEFLLEQQRAGFSETQAGPGTPSPTLDALATDDTCESLFIRVDEQLASKISSYSRTGGGSQMREAVAAALLRALAASDWSGDCTFEVTVDQRNADRGLSHTTGPMTIRRSLQFKRRREPVSSTIQQVRAVLSRPGQSPAGDASSMDPEHRGSGRRALINLEYLADEPWFGSHLWVPQGFVEIDTRPKREYAIELRPLLSRSHCGIRINHHSAPWSEESLRALTQSFDSDLRDALEYLEKYHSAKSFWIEEYTRGSQIPVSYDEPEKPDDLSAAWNCVGQMDGEAVERLRLVCDVRRSSILLAGFAVLLARLSGQEYVSLLLSAPSTRGNRRTPLRVYASWESGFTDVALQLDQKRELASRYSEYAFEFLADVTPSSGAGARLAVDGDVVFSGGLNSIEDVLKFKQQPERSCPVTVTSGLTLVLESSENRVNPLLLFQEGRHEYEGALKQLSYLSSILEQAAAQPGLPIAEINVDNSGVASDLTDELALETFSFN